MFVTATGFGFSDPSEFVKRLPEMLPDFEPPDDRATAERVAKWWGEDAEPIEPEFEPDPDDDDPAGWPSEQG